MVLSIDNLEIGIDIVNIDRFKKIPYGEKPSFYKKIFTIDEINYCLKFSEPYKHFAGKFAAKEALQKSILQNIALLDIETNSCNVKPTIRIKNNNNYKFKLSISHDKTIAIAIVLSEKTLYY